MSRHNRYPVYPSNRPDPPRQLSLFAPAPRGSGLLPSAELDAIVATALAPGELLKIEAVAGSGKSTALREYAKAHPQYNTLYVVFNASVQEV